LPKDSNKKHINPALVCKNGINRIIDANINRLKEGLRVSEEITRFILNNTKLTSDFKKIRHDIDSVVRLFPAKLRLLKARDSQGDTGKNIYINELKRKSYGDIFFANIQRAKESARVLEEFGKLVNSRIALKLKNIRYALYKLERKTAFKL
jgi:thiamine-phosphate pyrophosphorylase